MYKRFKELPLYVKIIAGMFLGVILGLTAVHLDFGELITMWIKPLGRIFMNALKLIAVPLILVSLIQSIGSLGNIASLSKIGIRTIAMYLGTTLIAIFVGLFFVWTISPGKIAGEESTAGLRMSYETAQIEKTMAEASAKESDSALQGLVEVVPENIMEALSSNANMLQVIFIALIIGVAALKAGREGSASFMAVVDSLNLIILKIVDIVMMFAPLGVMALIAGTVVDGAGNMNLLGALGTYALTVVLALLSLIFIVYPILLTTFSKVPIRKFIKEMSPVQLLAFSTSSSAATLPFNLECAETKLGISKRTASFVLPVGVTINMDGTSCYQVIAAVFIAQILGIDLSWQEIMILIATTTISSIGTPGVPGGSVVILMMVLGSIGIPAEGMILIMGIDRPLDMLRTVVNVTGDAAVAAIVDAQTSNDDTSVAEP